VGGRRDRASGVRRTGGRRRLLETGAQHLEIASAAAREQRRQAAIQARALAAFAAARPAAALDRPDDEVGAAAAASRAARPAALTAVSEWAVDEVMVALAMSSAAASNLLAQSVTLVEEFPATLAALEAGVIGPAHARMLTDVLAPLGPYLRGEVETRLLAGARGRTVAQLRASAKRAVLRADASAAARRLAAAIRDRSVRAHPGEDGMGTLAATMPIPLLEACRAALRGYAEECATPDDVRTLDQRMLDCLADLILRPGAGDVSPVQVQLTLVAGVDTMRGGDEPGELNGQPVPAVLVRELAQTLGLLPNVTDRSRLDPTEISVPVPTDAIPTGPDPAADGAHFPPSSADAAAPPPLPVSASDLARARLAELLALRSTVGTALAGPPQIAVVDEISGQLLALTSAAGIGCALAAGTGLGPPPETPGYRPSAPLERFVRARDRRCRFPGCRAAAIRCDLDHNQIWPAGATSEGNLCCLCRHHHRLSHQAPGWTMHRLPDGGLRWTSPSGHVLTTHPPAYGSDDQPQPENPDPVRPPGTLELLRRAPQPPDPTDPAPF